MSVVTASTSKGEKSKKFQSLDINNIYQGSASKPQQKAIPQKHGLQSLGKVPTARRAPANLPSLKAENSGNDPTVNLVPAGSSGWGKDDAVSSSNTGSSSNNKGVLGNGGPPSSSNQQQQGQKPPSQHDHIHHPPQTNSNPSDLNTSKPPSWNNSVNQGPVKRQDFHGQRSNPLFGQEFPSLSGSVANGQEDFTGSAILLSGSASTGSIAQKLKGEVGNDLKYGPGPNLRPQTFGNWSHGGGSKPQNDGSNDVSNTQTPSMGSSSHGKHSEQQPPSQILLSSGGLNIHQQPPPNIHQRDLVSAASQAFKFDVSTKPGHSSGPGLSSSLLRKSASNVDVTKQRNNVQRGPRKDNSFSASFQKQSIIDDEKLKRMDELENEDSDWTKCDDAFDYNKKIASDDEEDPNSNWTDHIKQPDSSKLASDLYEGGNQSRRVNVQPSPEYLDEEEQRRAKNEEVLKTIERAKRRREEEEQKYKSQYSSQSSYNRNDYDYHGGGGQNRFHQEPPRDRRQPSGGDRNSRRSPGNFRPRDNHDHRQQPLSSQGANQPAGFGKFDVGNMGTTPASSKPLEQSDQRALQDEQRAVVQKEERNQQHYSDTGRFGGRKPVPQSSIPPRFKRNGGELHQIKRTSPPKDGSPEISGNIDSKDEFGSYSRGSSTRKSPGSWDRQSSSGGSDIRDRHPSTDKTGGSLADVLNHKENEPSPASIMDAVKSPYSFVAGGTERSNEFFDRGDSKDFLSVDGGQQFGTSLPSDHHMSVGNDNDWNQNDSDSQTNNVTPNDPAGRRDYDGGRYHEDNRYGKHPGKFGRHDQGFGGRGVDKGDKRGGRGGRRGDPNSSRSTGGDSSRFDRSQGRSGSSQPAQQRKIVLPSKGRHQQDAVPRKDETQDNGIKSSPEDLNVGVTKEDVTEAMKSLSMGSSETTPPPPLEQLAPTKIADLQVLQQLQQQKSGQVQFGETLQQKNDFGQEQDPVPIATDPVQLNTLQKPHGEQGPQAPNAGWFAPRGQPSRRGRGGLNMGVNRSVNVQEPSNQMNTNEENSGNYFQQRSKRDEEWDASSDRSYEEKKADNFGDSNYSRGGGGRNQRYPDGGYGRRGTGDRKYEAKEKRGGGSLMDRGGSKGMGFENRRQSKLPPRLAKQKEQSRMGPGSNPTGWESSGPMDSIPANSFSAWGDHDQTVMQQRHQMMADFGSFRDSEGVDAPNANVGPGGDGIGQAGQAKDNVVPSESQNAPVQTIIFENTNFKGGRGPVQGMPTTSGVVGNMAASLGSEKLGFKNIGDVKPENLQMPLGFVGAKGGDDAGGLSLDFNFVDTDASMHPQAHHHDQKMPSLTGVAKANTASSMTHHNNHPTEDLNMKIASVKKVWEPMASMSPVPDSSSAFTQGFTSNANSNGTDAKAFVSGGNSNRASGQAGGNGNSNEMEPADKASPTNSGFGSSEKAVETVGTSNVAKVRPQQQQSQLQTQPSQHHGGGVPPHHIGAQQHGFQQLQDERAASFRAAAAMMNAGHTGAAGNGGSGNYNRLAGLGSGTLPAALQSPQSILNQPPSLYPTFQLDQSRGVTTNQLYSAYAAGLGGQASVLLPSSGLSAAGSGADIFGANPGTQFRLQGASGAAQFAAPGQQQSSGNTVLLSQPGLISSQVKQSNQIGPIGTKGGNGPFQQSGLGTLPASGTSPLHLIPFDSQGNAQINYAMPNAAMQRSQQQAGQTAFYQAFSASTQQAAAASRQQSGFPQGFAAHPLSAQLRNPALAASVTIAPPPPVGMSYLKPDASTVQVSNSVKGGGMASGSGRNDSFGGVQYGTAHQQKPYATANQSNAGGNPNNGPVSVSSTGPTYSPTPIQRPMGVQGKQMANDDDSVSDLKDNKKNANEE